MRAALGLLLLLALAPARAETETAFQNVVVRPGDTLWSISNRFLKDPAKWDEILKYNRLPSSDPTLALPGMNLRVPITLIKEELRAAHRIYKVNRVDFRRKETADWKDASEAMELFRGDSIRTMEDSKAKVKFLNSDLLSLDANSMAVLKPVNKDYDVELKKGGLFVGHSRVVTASARIIPRTKDTEYSAKVRQDLSTLVEVSKGQAGVEAQGRVVEVKAGMGTEVKLGLAPSIPVKIVDLPEFEARAADYAGAGSIPGISRMKIAPGAQVPLSVTADDVNAAKEIGDLGGEVQSLSVGMPVSGYHVQASKSREFSSILFDKTLDGDEKFRPKDILPAGVYWWRIALIDLLGTEGSFSSPRLYSVGGAVPGRKAAPELKSSIVLTKPAVDETVYTNTYQVKGLVKRDNLTVSVNGKAMRIDDAGNFQLVIKLSRGVNDVIILVQDDAGNSLTLTRRLTYEVRF